MAPGPYDNDPACVCARCLQRAVQRHRLCLLCLLAQVDDMITGAATDVLRPVSGASDSLLTTSVHANRLVTPSHLAPRLS